MKGVWPTPRSTGHHRRHRFLVSLRWTVPLPRRLHPVCHSSCPVRSMYPEYVRLSHEANENVRKWNLPVFSWKVQEGLPIYVWDDKWYQIPVSGPVEPTIRIVSDPCNTPIIRWLKVFKFRRLLWLKEIPYSLTSRSCSVWSDTSLSDGRLRRTRWTCKWTRTYQYTRWDESVSI